MARDQRYNILFKPLKIDPLTAKCRFFQVTHCNGMGSVYPSSMAAMRAGSTPRQPMACRH